MDKIPKIYIAGPDVFKPQVKVFFDTARSMCADLSLQALCPYNGNLCTAQEIYDYNLQLLREADGLVANFDPFRGVDPDVGTGWEHGFATARGIPTVGYFTDNRTTFDKTVAHFNLRGAQLAEVKNDGLPMPDGMKCERWGHPFNLMLHKSSTEIIKGSLLNALVQIRELTRG